MTMKRTAAIGLPALIVLALTGAAGASDLPDPTRPLGGVAAAGGGLQSILVSPQRRLAVIDGRTVGVGDRVGSAVVAEIQPYEVVLRRGNQETRMRLVPRLDKQAANRTRE